jgi:ribosomal protein S8
LSAISRPPRFLPKGGKHIVTSKSGALEQQDAIKRRIGGRRDSSISASSA